MRPDTVADVVSAFRDTTGPIRIVGGGTSARPHDGAVTLDLAGLAGVLDVRPADLVATVRAGTRLTDLAVALQQRGRRLPVAPFDAGRGTLGGACADGADGLRARFGFRLRDQVLAATAVLPSGDVVRVGAPVVKSVAGFDVARLLVGAGGTFAALAEVTVRIEATPETATTVGATFRTLTDAVLRARREAASPHTPSAVVVRSADDVHEVRVLHEGGRAAVRAATDRARDLGLSEVTPPWEAWTADAARAAPHGLVRAEGDDRSPPQDALLLLLDVLRGRYVAHVPPPGPIRHVDPLLARLHAAFDPQARLVGRGPR